MTAVENLLETHEHRKYNLTDLNLSWVKGNKRVEIAK